jgi:hypothetical protein
VVKPNRRDSVSSWLSTAGAAGQDNDAAINILIARVWRKTIRTASTNRQCTPLYAERFVWWDF